VEKLGLSRAQAGTLCQHPATVAFYEAVLQESIDPIKAANFVLTEVLRGAKFHGLDARFTVTPDQVVGLLSLVGQGKITGKQAKDVFAKLEGSDKQASAIVSEQGLEVVSDAAMLEGLLRGLLAQHPKQVQSMREGNMNLAGFFIGQVMKATRGSASPQLVSELLNRLVFESQD
jgi:aspartyl-tRNA(Asn)/glutamyl-tRNA(Gln) amidotransferase subunit B